MSMFTLYLLVKLDAVGNLLGWGLGVSLGVIVIYLFVCGMAKIFSEQEFNSEEVTEEIKVSLKSNTKKMIIIPTVFAILATLIPSTKEVAFIYIMSKLTQNKTVQDIGDKSLQIPDKALEILNFKMQEYISEMGGEALKESKKVVQGVKEEIKK